MSMPTLPASPLANVDRGCADSRVSAISSEVILYAAAVVLALAVLAFGAVQEWSICALECGAALLFALWAAHEIAHGRVRLTNRSLIPGLMLLLLPVVQLASGQTAYSYATHYELMKWIAYGVFFLVASELSGSSSARKRLAVGITIFGALYALFAIIQGFIISPDLLYGVVKTHGTGFGSYTNRNHYAGLMEMVLPFGLVVSTSRSLPHPLRLLSAFGSLVMLASIFVSGSRGGMISTLVTLSVFALYSCRHQRTSSTALRTVLVSTIAATAFVAYFSYERVASRAVVEATDSMRWQIARDSLRLIAKHPFIGSGLGTFTSVYPAVRSFPTNLFVNAAHNDYVQLAVETGLLGLLCAAAFLFLVFNNALRQVHRTRQTWFSSVSLAAMLGIIALLVHSLFDFNLQIPANAATFAFLAGLASAGPDREHTNSTED